MRTKPLTENEQRVLNSAKARGFDIAVLLEHDYDYLQMMIIEAGMINGLDISRFAYPELKKAEMYEVYRSLLKEKIFHNTTLLKGEEHGNICNT